jgi:hypothetical protein
MVVTETAQTLVRYTCHLLSVFAEANAVPWEAPEGLLLQTDLVCEAAVLAMTLVHDAVILVRALARAAVTAQGPCRAHGTRWGGWARA